MFKIPDQGAGPGSNLSGLAFTILGSREREGGERGERKCEMEIKRECRIIYT